MVERGGLEMRLASLLAVTGGARWLIPYRRSGPAGAGGAQREPQLVTFL